MAITVNIVEQNASSPCGHGKATFTIGSTPKTFYFNKEDMGEPLTDDDIEVNLRVVLRFLAKAAGVSTWAGVKTKFANKVISL